MAHYHCDTCGACKREWEDCPHCAMMSPDAQALPATCAGCLTQRDLREVAPGVFLCGQCEGWERNETELNSG